MVLNSKLKGSGGELEFSRLVHDLLGVKLVRNLVQTRNGGCDLEVEAADNPVAQALAKFAIEIKRHRSFTQAEISTAWKQAEIQAVNAGKIPCLAIRADSGPWSVKIPLHVLNRQVFQTDWSGIVWTASLSTPAFCALIREGGGS